MLRVCGLGNITGVRDASSGGCPSVASADHRILHTVVGENVLTMLQFLSGCCWHILLRLVSGPEEICGIVNEQILQ